METKKVINQKYCFMCNFYTEIYREKSFLNFVDDLSLRHFAPQDIENYRIQPEHLIG